MNELSREELVIINNALNEVLHGPDAIEEWEFHTRMGVTKDEGERLLVKIGRLLGKTSSGIS
jgi:hypothetical protein